MASNITDLGGYDCKFVEEPPDDLICLICTFVAKDPQQVTCCGRIYCRACLVEQKKKSSVCPQCRESGTSIEDKKSNHAIQNLKVKCNNVDSACEWIGELHKLNDHLLEECQKVKISCTNKGCKVQLPREELFNHRRDDCPFEIFPCKHFHIGCTTELLRKDRESHENNDQLHLHLAIETISKMQSGIVNTSTDLDQDGFTFKMADFENHKTKDMRYYSPPFYTEPGGYKICVVVHANGWRDGYKKSVSVFVYFMRGENDDNLAWPFTGTVTIDLLNQLEDFSHCTCVVNYVEDENNDDDDDSNESDDDDDSDESQDDNNDDKHSNVRKANNQVIVGDIAKIGYGKPSFILHSDLGYKPDLDRQYLKDDCLFFEVTAEAPEAIKPWLTCTK